MILYLQKLILLEYWKYTPILFLFSTNLVTKKWLSGKHYFCFVIFRKVFYPETTDIYDMKNMPRAIYCVHALR